MVNLLQIICAVVLTAAILLQARGSGLGSAFGGSGNIYRTKRGAEKFLFNATIVTSILFFAIAFVNSLVIT